MAEIYCLVDAGGEVYSRTSADSYGEVAESLGLDQDRCGKYRFDLESRRMHEDHGLPAGRDAVRAYLARYLGTPEKLMDFVAERPVSKQALASLLDARIRPSYLDACARIEKTYTAECAAANDPCLESGCSIDQAEGEICLQPLLNARSDYYEACAAEWIKLFRSPRNRIETWR